MEKIGKSGFKIIALALLGYFFAYYGMYLHLMLLLGFALLIEKSSVLNFQLAQVLVLKIAYDVVSGAWDLVYKVLLDIFDLFETKSETLHSLQDFSTNFSKFVEYAFIVLFIIGVVRVFKHAEAKIPFIGNLTKKIME